jgi:hypothetical protein
VKGAELMLVGILVQVVAVEKVAMDVDIFKVESSDGIVIS